MYNLLGSAVTTVGTLAWKSLSSKYDKNNLSCDLKVVWPGLPHASGRDDKAVNLKVSLSLFCEGLNFVNLTKL